VSEPAFDFDYRECNDCSGDGFGLDGEPCLPCRGSGETVARFELCAVCNVGIEWCSGCGGQECACTTGCTC
jgi:hypothetical protein